MCPLSSSLQHLLPHFFGTQLPEPVVRANDEATSPISQVRDWCPPNHKPLPAGGGRDAHGMRWTPRWTEDELKNTTEEEQQKALMRDLGMMDATWRVSSRMRPLSGDAVSSSTTRPPRRVKPEKPRSPTTSCPNKQKIGITRLLSTTSTSHKTPTQSLCALRLSCLSSSSDKSGHRVSTICFCARRLRRLSWRNATIC